jgi:hypothetical protein
MVNNNLEEHTWRAHSDETIGTSCTTAADVIAVATLIGQERASRTEQFSDERAVVRSLGGEVARKVAGHTLAGSIVGGRREGS